MLLLQSWPLKAEGPTEQTKAPPPHKNVCRMIVELMNHRHEVNLGQSLRIWSIVTFCNCTLKPNESAVLVDGNKISLLSKGSR